jgi:hypothetical protein
MVIVVSNKELKELLAQMEKYQKKIAESKKEDAIKILVKAGICDSTGKLESHYR